MNIENILTIRATMREKAEGKETMLVNANEVRALIDYIDRLDQRMKNKERELRIAEDDSRFLNEQLKSYEANPICRLVMTIISKVRQFKEWKSNRKKIRYQFKLQSTEEL